MVVLTVCSAACLYIICYLSKGIERTRFLRSALSKIGRDSLYIMAFHFIGFKVAGEISKISGLSVNLWELVPKTGSNVLLSLYYLFFGVGIPILINVFVHKTKDIGKIIVRK